MASPEKVLAYRLIQ